MDTILAFTHYFIFFSQLLNSQQLFPWDARTQLTLCFAVASLQKAGKVRPIRTRNVFETLDSGKMHSHAHCGA